MAKCNDNYDYESTSENLYNTPMFREKDIIRNKLPNRPKNPQFFRIVLNSNLRMEIVVEVAAIITCL